MLTVRQINALVELNKAIAAAEAAGVFDAINCTESVVESFSTEMQQAEREDHDLTPEEEYDGFLTRVANRLAD